jgi:hypothetical protein
MKKQIAKNQAQQGDVLLMRVPSLPAGCKKRKSLTIALGEHTGHHHTFEDDGGTAVMDAPDGTIYVVRTVPETEAKPLVHQEHKSITLAPGIYRFEPVQEKDWFADMVRAVKD